MPEFYHVDQLPLFPTSFPTTKVCKTCRIEKPVSDFYKDSRALDGYRYECINCFYIRQGEDPKAHSRKFLLPIGVSSKTCNRCGFEKSIEEFPKNSSSRDGYKSICKICNYATTKTSREANKEQHKERTHAEYVRNVETKRKYRRENAEDIKAYYRNRRANDPVYRQKMNEYQSEYASSHREQMNRYVRKWKEANPLKGTEYAMRYKARKQAVTVEEVDYERIFQESDGICYICNKQILPHHDIEFDHIIPITRQGPHSYENVKMVHQCCNSRKSDKLLEEMTSHQRRGPKD